MERVVFGMADKSAGLIILMELGSGLAMHNPPMPSERVLGKLYGEPIKREDNTVPP